MLHILDLPQSKSVVIRQMVDGFMKTGVAPAVGGGACEDVKTVAAALSVVCRNAGGRRFVPVDVRDCGAAYRFMMAVLSVTPGHWFLTGNDVLLGRPVGELADVLSAAGADIRGTAGGWRIVGRPLSAPCLHVDCTRSSQFASALLLIAPKLGLRRLEISPPGFGSMDYVQLTRSVTGCGVEVPGLPEPRGLAEREGDWSAAVYGYALARLHPGDVYELQGLSLHSVQGDAAVAGWFADLGVDSEELPAGVRISASRPFDGRPRAYDAACHPDLVPVMAALAVLLPADFTFLHVGNLKYKESDRLAALTGQLRPFAEVAEGGAGTLHVAGLPHDCRPAPPYRFRTLHDHRLAMAFLLFGNDARLDDTACLCKSYPQLYESLNGK